MKREIYHLMHEVEESHWWFVARRQIIRRLLERVIGARLEKILDVGCGTGGNFQLLSEFGDVEGLECEPEAIELARKRGFSHIYRGSMPEDLPLDDRRYNLITLFDVLEHIDDDERTMQRVSSLLVAGGWVMVTVPAFPFLWSEHDQSHHHKRRYRRQQLHQLASKAGLSCEYVSYFNTLLMPLIVVIRFMKRLFGMHGDEERLPPVWLNRLLRVIMASERLLMPGVKLPFGVSILMVCRKPKNGAGEIIGNKHIKIIYENHNDNKLDIQ